ncbi:MAG: Asp-tRNA(Asn)/Glu-tRNA(Gln) amidotransferase subunit GatB [Candidatus Kaiserbacteria bacterium]|nr:Asp-tRNA(Asn)/Glu-tRNA(Gln) amidotransferase subunit GatB [Candidatus Kaiserbacteria bacterium]
MEYRPTIGLEIHAELKTRTKMFCDSANDPDEARPNVNICPICTAHPGTLPAINREAVRHILRIGTAVGGTIADWSEFDRKSYFYPDIPKGYQISQYAHPLVSGGTLAGVALTRIHLEEDTARSIHVGGKAGDTERSECTEGGKSFVDFNRAGIPLMELVTEPVIHDAKTAGDFARELQLLLRALGVGEANLEKGEMRIEANVSVSNKEGKLGTKVEVKNLNSFRSVERAIAFEIDRQIALLEKGGEVIQETRGWDETKQITFHQRSKEVSADYRYFPEPDLPKLFLSEIPEFSPENIRASLPELPWERRTRYAPLGLKTDDVEFIIASDVRNIFFDAVIQELGDTRESVILAANYFISDLAGESDGITPASFAKLIRMVSAGDLSSRGAKDVLMVIVKGGGDPEKIAKEKGLVQVHDTTVLTAVVEVVLAQEGKAVQEYKNGKQAALQYLVGKAMRESRGAGNPETLREILLAKLNLK